MPTRTVAECEMEVMAQGLSMVYENQNTNGNVLGLVVVLGTCMLREMT